MEIAGQEYQWCHWSTKVSCPEEPADGKQHVLPARFFKTKESWSLGDTAMSSSKIVVKTTRI